VQALRGSHRHRLEYQRHGAVRKERDLQPFEAHFRAENPAFVDERKLVAVDLHFGAADKKTAAGSRCSAPDGLPRGGISRDSSRYFTEDMIGELASLRTQREHGVHAAYVPKQVAF
jgi:hypothetical protein